MSKETYVICIHVERCIQFMSKWTCAICIHVRRDLCMHIHVKRDLCIHIHVKRDPCVRFHVTRDLCICIHVKTDLCINSCQKRPMHKFMSKETYVCVFTSKEKEERKPCASLKDKCAFPLRRGNIKVWGGFG